jgi:hypothetical protein
VGGTFRPLLIAGVAGGVGTSTWTRIMRLAVAFPVQELGIYRGGVVDVLVTSNSAAATARLSPALAMCPRPPLLVVMHTVPGVVAASRSHLRKAAPHVTARFDIQHHRRWLEMAAAPGERVPERAKDVISALRGFPQALHDMYAAPAVDVRRLAPMAPRRALPPSGPVPRR